MSRSIPYRVYRFYVDGFRSMTWGRMLWVLVLIKLAVMFIILRLIFFTPHMQGLDPQQRSDYVREQLTTPGDARKPPAHE